MSLYEYNKGYADGYETAYKEMRSFLNSKDISPIDEMYGRYPYVYPDGATGIPVESTIGYTANGPTGPIGYMP